MYGEGSTEMIRLKKYLARKNKAVRKQTLEDVRAGVPEEPAEDADGTKFSNQSEVDGFTKCLTTVLEHLDLLGNKE